VLNARRIRLGPCHPSGGGLQEKALRRRLTVFRPSRGARPPFPPAGHVGFRLVLMLTGTVVMQLDVSHWFRVFAVAMVVCRRVVLFRRRAVRAFAIVLLAVFLVRLAVLLARLQ
jgi:hypothetical protein